jgi:hypothetical protein
MRSMCALVASCLLASCGMTTGTLYGLTGEWPTTSTIEDKQWIDGTPSHELVVEAQLDHYPRVMCEYRTHNPPAHVTVDSYGFDAGGRLAYGFFGIAELGIAAAMFFLPRGPEGCVGCDVGGTIIAVDGLTALLMAFLIPNERYHSERTDPAHTLLDPTCPPQVQLEAAGRSFQIQPDGYLSPADLVALMNGVVETGSAIGLRLDNDVRWTPVPPELRCRWAIEVGSPLVPVLCPHGPP